MQIPEIEVQCCCAYGPMVWSSSDGARWGVDCATCQLKAPEAKSRHVAVASWNLQYGALLREFRKPQYTMKRPWFSGELVRTALTRAQAVTGGE